MADDKQENNELTPDEVAKLSTFRKTSPESLEFSVHSAKDREQIQALARQAKKAVLEIIQERGYSTEPDSRNHNLAFRLNEAKLDSTIETGRTREELDFNTPTGSGPIMSLDFYSGEVLDQVSKRHPGLYIYRNPNDAKVYSQAYSGLVGEIIGSFARKLGFLSDDEDIRTGNPRINIIARPVEPEDITEEKLTLGASSMEIVHPADPFVLKIYLNSVPIDYKENPAYHFGDIVPRGLVSVFWKRSSQKELNSST